MNREQYLAKRMWMSGIAPDASDIEACSAFSGEDEASEPPTTSPLLSLSEYYRCLHDKEAGNKPGKAN